MGRYNGGSGSGGVAGGALAIINSVLPAGERIQRGDIVLVGADGKGYAAALPSDSVIAQAMRPTAGGPLSTNFQVAAKTVLGSSLTGAGADCYDVVELTNKNILVAALDGTSAVGKPLFSVLDPEGNVVVSARAVANLSGNDAGRNISAVALPNGGFALGYTTSTGTWLAVYDSAGAQVLPPFQVGPAGFFAIRIARLTNNSIVIFTANTTTGAQNFSYSVYKADGTVVKAAANIVTSSYGTWNDRCLGVVGLAGGGFALGWIIGAASSAAAAQYRVFDNSGTPIGNASNLWPQNSSNIIGFCYLVSLPDGGFAMAAYSSTVGAHLGIFNAAGVLRTNVINLGLPDNVTYGNSVAIAAGPNGIVGVIAAIPSGVVGSTYSSAGVLLAGPKVIEAFVSGNQSCGSLSFNEDGSAFASVSSTANSGAAKVIFLNSAFTPTLTWQSTYSQSNSWGRPKLMGVSNPKVDGVVYMLFYQQSPSTAIGMVSNIASRQPLTTLGIATNNVDKDGQVGVQMTGMATLRRPFTLPWATNQQMASPPGQRMYAVGSTAVMSGIQPVAPNPIN